MPTLLPKDPRAKTIERNRSSDWVAIAAVSVGIFGLILAGIVYLTSGDKFIVSYLMFVAAALVAMMLRWDIGPRGAG